MSKAVFFDRDGVLLKMVARDGKLTSARSLREMHLMEGAKQAVSLLSESGFSLFVVTNQPDIARGLASAQGVEEVNEKLISELEDSRYIRKVYVCPHDDKDRCGCRKPKPGLIFQAAQEWSLDLNASFFVGDQEKDMLAGKAAGCRTILVKTHYNTNVTADYRVENLLDACNWIITQEKIGTVPRGDRSLEPGE